MFRSIRSITQNTQTHTNARKKEITLCKRCVQATEAEMFNVSFEKKLKQKLHATIRAFRSYIGTLYFIKINETR